MPTILHRLDKWAKESPHSTAQRYKSGDAGWIPISSKEFRDRVHYLALFLRSKGVTADQVGAILSYNCPQWIHMELAMLLLGAKTAGLYPNSTPKDIKYILHHTEASVLSVQNKAYFDKVAAESGDDLKHVSLIIAFDGDTSISPKAVSYEQALEEGRKLAEKVGSSASADSFESLLSKLDPKAGSILIYTSGTTGNPKGALLSHDNLVYTTDLVIKAWSIPVSRGSMYSFLPLCHIAEQLQNVGAGISLRCAVSFATAFDNVSKELPEVQPKLLLCVPRVWEKMMEGVQSKVNASKGFRKYLALWALHVGSKNKIADILVLSKIRHALGLAEAEVVASGAAALPAHVQKWFGKLGLEILEDFGQTESTGVISVTIPGMNCAGTVGRPAPGVEFKLAADGEILTKGRHVFVGYFKDPESTKATLVDGWLHTGDLGAWTEDGMLKIIGRKKEVMKTSGGKMVAPMPIEEKLKAASIISQVCIVGEGRKYLSALITLSDESRARLQSTPGAFDGQTVKDKETLDQVAKCIEDLNRSLASFEQIKKFAVLALEFTVDSGEMTPTLKVKRSVIERNYQALIEQFYNI